jgi:hypothetical protein
MIERVLLLRFGALGLELDGGAVVDCLLLFEVLF